MGKVWVQAKTILYELGENGLQVIYHPNDWLELPAAKARQYIADGRAEIARPDIKQVVMKLPDCGVLVRGDLKRATIYLHTKFPNIEIAAGDIDLPWPYTLLWNTACPLRLDLLIVGFHWLQTGWQMAAPLYRYRILAAVLGTKAEREKTQAIIHDLRVPVYETGCIYARRTPETLRLIDLWKAERAEGGEDKLAFMRALYQSKPILCALPVIWCAGMPI